MRRKLHATNIDVRATAAELRAATGGFVQKVAGSAERLVLRIRVPGPPPARWDLVVEPGRWAYVLPGGSDEEPGAPDGFVLLLRKHLANALVVGSRQEGFDRILTIHLRKQSDYRLVLELFGEGNVILVEGETILRPLRRAHYGHRTVAAGEPFRLPPPGIDPGQVDLTVLRQQLAGATGTLVKVLAGALHLGGTAAEEVCATSGVPPGTDVRTLTADQARGLHDGLVALLSKAEGVAGPVIVEEAGEAVDVAPFPLAAFAGKDLLKFGRFGEAVAAYSQRVPAPTEDARGRELERLRRLEKQQSAAVARLEGAAKVARTQAEALYGNFPSVERFLAEAAAAYKEGGWAAVLKRFPESAPDPEERTAVLRITDPNMPEPLEVRLAIDGTVHANAKALYEVGKDHQERANGARRALATTQARARTAEAAPAPAPAGPARRRTPRRQHWFESYRWFLTTDGYLVVAGRDVASNERLVKRHLKQGGRFLHADVHGAPSVVLDGARPGIPPAEAVAVAGAGAGATEEEVAEGGFSTAAMEEACAFALIYSRAWGSKVASGSAFWVLPEQVSKTPESGEHVPRGAFVIRGKRNYVHRIPLHAALGLVLLQGEERLMGGPPSAVRSRATRFLEIRPGNGRREDLARRVAASLDLSADEVLRLLPPGGIEVAADHGLIEAPQGGARAPDGGAPPVRRERES